MCSPGQLVHFYRSEGRVFPCLHHPKTQEISAFLIPAQPLAVQLLPGAMHFFQCVEDGDESINSSGQSALAG